MRDEEVLDVCVVRGYAPPLIARRIRALLASPFPQTRARATKPIRLLRGRLQPTRAPRLLRLPRGALDRIEELCGARTLLALMLVCRAARARGEDSPLFGVVRDPAADTPRALFAAWADPALGERCTSLRNRLRAPIAAGGDYIRIQLVHTCVGERFGPLGRRRYVEPAEHRLERGPSGPRVVFRFRPDPPLLSFSSVADGLFCTTTTHLQVVTSRRPDDPERRLDCERSARRSTLSERSARRLAELLGGEAGAAPRDSLYDEDHGAERRFVAGLTSRRAAPRRAPLLRRGHRDPGVGVFGGRRAPVRAGGGGGRGNGVEYTRRACAENRRASPHPKPARAPPPPPCTS